VAHRHGLKRIFAPAAKNTLNFITKTIMSKDNFNVSPWQMAYDHKNFSNYTKDEIDELTFAEIIEIFNQN
jgi:hypothetical protein